MIVNVLIFKVEPLFSTRDRMFHLKSNLMNQNLMWRNYHEMSNYNIAFRYSNAVC